MALKDSLLAIERELWKSDTARCRDKLDEGAELVFPETGPTPRDAAVEAIRQETAAGRGGAGIEFTDERLIKLTDDVAVLVYRSRASWGDGSKFVLALCSSTYVRRSGGWKLALHQQVEG